MKWVLALAALVVATRAPLFEKQLFSFDDVNLAYAVGELDVRKSQPHPPGYPLFVLQMRALDWLRVKRAESQLQALSILGSIASLAAMVLGFRRPLGQPAAVLGALLLLFHPSFWYAGLTSALRVQLALVSIAVAAACWRARAGEPGWVTRSAWIFGLGAGIRPELAVALFPLWAWTSWRGWKHLLPAFGVWIVPLLWLSGGPSEYAQATFEYLADQASLTSAIFGATESLWRRSLVWLFVWIFTGCVGWTATLILAAGRLREVPWAFFAIWTVPPLLFYGIVHVADPGQTLAIVAPVCLLGGWIVARAAERLAGRGSHRVVGVAMLLPVALALALWIRHPREAIAVTFAAGVAGGLAMRRPGSRVPLAQAALLLIGPVYFLDAVEFFYPKWYYEGPGILGALLQDIHSGWSATTYHQMRHTIHADHGQIELVRNLWTPGAAIVWDKGIVSARKLAYYFPHAPVVERTTKTLDPASPPVLKQWRGPRAEPVAHPPPERLIWVLGPQSARRCPGEREFVCLAPSY
ncbi:MAG: hypothetical protein SFV18_06285 [Bryobacteraceae bacterium]|nr:hypothetical protein [Bryobacteraceae bacterium]